MRRSRVLDLAAMAGLVVLAFFLRRAQLAIPHDRGDQLIFAAIARNVDARGFPAGATLRGVDHGWMLQRDREGNERPYALWVFRPVDTKGNLLEGLVKSGEAYWDAPLANQPPVFTGLLLASHAVLGRGDDGFPLVGRSPTRPINGVQAEERLARELAAAPRPELVRAQLWATIVPLGSDLATVVLIYVIGVLLFGRRGAIVAAALYACDPLAIFAAHRILSNATLATTCAATIAAWAFAERGKLGWFVVAGVLAGVAILVKPSGVFLLPAGAVLLVRSWRRGAAFVGPALLLAIPWWWLAWRTLGHPLGLAWEQQRGWAQHSEWAQLVLGREAFFYPRVLARSPLLLLGVLGGVAAFLRALKRDATARERTLGFAGGLAILTLVAAQGHSGGKEGRHLLHVYPGLALIVGSWVETLRRRTGARARLFDVIVVSVIGAVCAWQAHEGLRAAFDVAGPPP